MNYLYLLLSHITTFGLGALWIYWKTRIETRATIDETRKNMPLKKNDEFIEYLENFYCDNKKDYFKILYGLCDGIECKSYSNALDNNVGAELIEFILNAHQHLKVYKEYLEMNNRFETLKSKFQVINDNKKIKVWGVDKLTEIQNYFMREIFIEIRNNEISQRNNNLTDFKSLWLERQADKITNDIDKKYKSQYDEKFIKLINEFKNKT